MLGRQPSFAAVVHIQSCVAGQNEVLLGEPEFTCQTINPIRVAFQFEKHADRGLVQRDDAILVATPVLGAILLVAENRLESKPCQDGLKRVGPGQRRFKFFAGFVPARYGGPL